MGDCDPVIILGYYPVCPNKNEVGVCVGGGGEGDLLTAETIPRYNHNSEGRGGSGGR